MNFLAWVIYTGVDVACAYLHGLVFYKPGGKQERKLMKKWDEPLLTFKFLPLSITFHIEEEKSFIAFVLCLLTALPCSHTAQDIGCCNTLQKVLLT